MASRDYDGVETRLVYALAEDLKQPLLRIAYKAELAIATGNTKALSDIAASSRSAMQLIDTLLLGFRSLHGQLQLELTPMAPSAILQNVQLLLSPHAALNNCTVTFENSGKQRLAMVHPAALTASLVSLGQVLIDEQSGLIDNAEIKFVSYYSGKNPTIGVFASGLEASLTHRLLKQARALYGRETQPAAGLMAVNSSGVFVAEQLLRAQSADLIQSNRGELNGLSAKLLPSRQLALV